MKRHSIMYVTVINDCKAIHIFDVYSFCKSTKPSKSDHGVNVSLEIYESIENGEILNKHQGY